MSKEFNQLIYLFSCAARGITPNITEKINFPMIYKLANEQNIWQTVFISLKQLDKSILGIDTQVLEQINDVFLMRIAKEANRRICIKNTIAYLEENGVECCRLKGEVLSELYAQPLCRVSSDTDILIDKKLEKKLCRLLEKKGYEVQPRVKTSHHLRCVHPVGGLFEFHLQLHDTLFEDVWFDNKTCNIENYREFKTKDGENFKTLGITDGAIFIAIHYIKHFLNEGAGIRQLMDFLMYMARYKNEIDQKRFDDLMQYLKYDKFIDLCNEIGVKYLNFTEEELWKNKKNEFEQSTVDEILNDMETGGVFGANEKLRENFYTVYTAERFSQFKTGSYDKYMNTWWRANILRNIFPSRKAMEEKYEYLKKMHWLLPFAWIHRFIDFILEFGKKREIAKNIVTFKLENENDDVIKDRLTLIKKLDMI